MDKNRLIPTMVFLIVAMLIFILTLVYIQIFRYEFYQKKAEAQQRRFIKIATDRGDIYSGDGQILATSLTSFSVYVNPRIFKDYEALSALMGETIKPLISKKYFAWIRRKVDRGIADKIKKAKLDGVGIVMEKKRVYPNSHLASQVLGFTGIDNTGLAGLELSLDNYLRAKAGWVKTYADPVGVEFLSAKSQKLDLEEEGLNVVLTIDHRIQYAVERELALAVKKFRAKSGTAIIMDVESGEILALASKPDFDPNHYGRFNKKLWNSPACAIFEPGSTFKAITVAAALDEGVVDLDTKLKAQETITVGGKVIGNAHEIKWPGAETSLSFMIEQSINTGSVQVALKLGKEKFHKIIKRFGFGTKTGFGLPGESRGIVNPPDKWYKPDIAMISFGQSIAVTPIQLVVAFSSFARGGKIVKPQIVKRLESRDGSFVRSYPPKILGRSVSAETAKKVMQLLQNVVVYGSGKPAAVKYYKVAGKTGTAQKVRPGRLGYMKDHYISSFIGIAPVDNPKICALVIIDDPRGTIWGATTAGPVFKRVVSETLRYLNIKPDALPES
ncbi:MAG: penicillin-binding protein 2 [Candidatus Saganbacteria bacterium]|nr:penicillin-binding protein 2 [Candidatus Saganbacteria bacterium]